MRKIKHLSLFIISLGFLNSAQAQNLAYGPGTLANTTSGYLNSGFGYHALHLNISGHENTAIGYRTLFGNTTGSNNTAIGSRALFKNATGYNNTATGNSTLSENTTGHHNTANGYHALKFNTTGQFNTAIGSFALLENTTGQFNTASGYLALAKNTSGKFNTASGNRALNNNTSGQYNTASGDHALYNNITGAYNVASGYHALRLNTTGLFNTANGGYALSNNMTGSFNTGLGYNATPNSAALTNTTALGFNATTTASNQIRLGNSSVSSIGGYQNWTNLSDKRFKKEVKENVVGLEFINKLRPVSYVVDRDKLDKFLGVDQSEFYEKSNEKAEHQTGFLAQEVEATAQEIGFDSFSGVDKPKNEKDHYGIRYAEFVVPLVKAVQELSSNQELLLAKIEEQQKQIESLLEINEQTGNNEQSRIPELQQKQGYELYQNSPNPFSSNSEIKMVLPETVESAKINIYNMQGQFLKSYAVNGTGNTSITINANELGTGMYIYALIADGVVVNTKQMILSK